MNCGGSRVCTWASVCVCMCIAKKWKSKVEWVRSTCLLSASVVWLHTLIQMTTLPCCGYYTKEVVISGAGGRISGKENRMGIFSWKETIGLQCFTKEDMTLLETSWGPQSSPGPTGKVLNISRAWIFNNIHGRLCNFFKASHQTSKCYSVPWSLSFK